MKTFLIQKVKYDLHLGDVCVVQFIRGPFSLAPRCTCAAAGSARATARPRAPVCTSSPFARLARKPNTSELAGVHRDRQT